MADGGNVEAENAEMVKSYNKQIAHHTKEMNEAMNKNGEVPAWVVAKMTRSASDLSDATHYMEGKGEEYATGGSIGFIPMDLEEKLAITAKWGGTDIKGHD
jgi:ribosomal protein L39E